MIPNSISCDNESGASENKRVMVRELEMALMQCFQSVIMFMWNIPGLCLDGGKDVSVMFL